MNLIYLEMSNNSFNASVFPSWIPTMQSLTSLMMEDTNLEGEVPAELFSLPFLQTVLLSNNKLNGTLDLGTSNANQFQLVDLQNNQISGYTVTNIPGRSSIDVILVDNPVCQESGVSETLCTIHLSTISYKTPPINCVPATCSPNQSSSPNFSDTNDVGSGGYGKALLHHCSSLNLTAFKSGYGLDMSRFLSLQPGTFYISDVNRFLLFTDTYSLGTQMIKGGLASSSLDATLMPEHLLRLCLEHERTFVPCHKTANYNFYKDSNASEMAKMVKLLVALQKRIRSLLDEWEDHLVLSKIMDTTEIL